MSINISQMFEGVEPEMIEYMSQAHQTYFEVMSQCMSDGCVDNSVFKEWLQSFIYRYDEVQAMFIIMRDRFEYDEDLDYSISIDFWVLAKNDICEACLDQLEVWSNLINDYSEESDDYIEAQDKIYWLDKSLTFMTRTY